MNLFDEMFFCYVCPLYFCVIKLTHQNLSVIWFGNIITGVWLFISMVQGQAGGGFGRCLLIGESPMNDNI